MQPDQLKIHFNDFLKKTSFIVFSLFAIYLLLFFSVPEQYLSPAIPAIIIFFTILTTFIFYYQIKASLKRTSKFVNFFLIATALKLLLFIVLVLIYSLLNKADAVNFILSFFVIYVIFSVFEVIQLLKLQDKISSVKQ
jgi:O-antigen/teichoic acid export membrane protein